MNTRSATTPTLSADLASISYSLRRSYQREFGRPGRLTVLQRELRDRAADLTAMAKLARLDPNTTSNDLVRLDGLAARARAEMCACFARDRRDRADGAVLEHYLGAPA